MYYGAAAATAPQSARRRYTLPDTRAQDLCPVARLQQSALSQAAAAPPPGLVQPCWRRGRTFTRNSTTPGCASVLVGLYGRSQAPPPRLGTRTITCCPAGSPSSCCLCGSRKLRAARRNLLRCLPLKAELQVRSRLTSEPC